MPFCLGNLSRGGWDDRYFKYNDEFIYLVGMDLQQLVSDSAIDYKKHIDILSQYNINKIRIWLIANFLSDWRPNLYPYSRKNGLFDLYQWDEAYWDRLDAVLKYAEQKSIIVEISIFEVSGPMKYFGERADKPYPFHKRFNLQNFGTPNSEGRFSPEFYDLNYKENGISLLSLQKALIDKLLEETKDNPNVYFEVMNEFPGAAELVQTPKVHLWAIELAKYIDSKTDKIVTVHSHGFGYRRSPEELESSSSYYWGKNYVDGLNFHLYISNPNEISNMLHRHQLKGKMLINNEGIGYYDIDRSRGYPNYKMHRNKKKLAHEIRALWAHITAGGYYLFYHGPVPHIGGPVSLDALKSLKAARNIVETLPFWQMRPVRVNGTEYDDIVLQGPAQNSQVLANEGQTYLVYFWGEKSFNSLLANVKLNLPKAAYEYKWYDTRKWGPPFRSGKVSEGISTPPFQRWNAASGVVLTIERIH
jgi:hypothetical protein